MWNDKDIEDMEEVVGILKKIGPEDERSSGEFDYCISFLEYMLERARSVRDVQHNMKDIQVSLNVDTSTMN